MRWVGVLGQGGILGGGGGRRVVLSPLCHCAFALVDARRRVDGWREALAASKGRCEEKEIESVYGMEKNGLGGNTRTRGHVSFHSQEIILFFF